MKHEIILFKNIYKSLEVLAITVPLFVLFSLMIAKKNPFEAVPVLHQFFEKHEILFCMTVITLVLSSMMFILTLMTRKREKSEHLLSTLSDLKTLSLRTKIDAYVKSMQLEASNSVGSYMHIDTHSTRIKLSGDDLDTQHTEHLKTIIREDLSEFFSDKEIKGLLKVGLKIPLSTTHPSSHHIFKMAALHANRQSNNTLTFGYYPHYAG
jgi:hypothetical protein